MVGDLPGEERIDHDEEAVRHGDRGAFSAPACSEPPILSGEVGVLGTRGGLRCFHEGGPQPGTSLPGPPRSSFACAVIVARTQPRPGDEVARAAKAAQIGADLGEQDLRGPPADAWDRLHSLQLGLKRAQARSNLSAHSLQTGIEEVDVGELLGNQEPLMRTELASQGLLQLGNLLPQSPARQLRERRRDTALLGADGYAALEQYAGQSQPRSDFYALGATLYHLVTGAPPESAPSRALGDTFRRPSDIVAELPHVLDDVLLRALALDAHDRYATADAFKAALNSCLESSDESDGAPSPDEIDLAAPTKPARTRRTAATIRRSPNEALVGVASVTALLRRCGRGWR
jgi:serine/threonine protein kinase